MSYFIAIVLLVIAVEVALIYIKLGEKGGS